MCTQWTCLALLVSMAWCAGTAHAQFVTYDDDHWPEAMEWALLRGECESAAHALRQRLSDRPEDDNARLGLSIVQLCRATERVSQALYQHGFYTNRRAVGMLGFIGISPPLPKLPVNPDPVPIGYDDFRKMMEQALADLREVIATLDPIHAPDVKLSLRFGQIHLDFDGDGRAGDSEAIWQVLTSLRVMPTLSEAETQQFRVTLDRADVEWLNGYCHLLSAGLEAALAYDMRDFFERTAHLMFLRVKSPHDFLSPVPRYMYDPTVKPTDEDRDAEWTLILDLIAAIHLTNFPVREPERLRTALDDLESMIEHSRRMWIFALDERDNDHEWLPSPRQTSVIPRVAFTDEQVRGWRDFLDEAQAVLQGRKLIPHHRINDGRGVNLKRMFTEPRSLDFVMWIQGTGATPYLERGELTDANTWRRLENLFGGRFAQWAVFIN